MGKDIQVEECLESKKKNMLERKESFSYSRNYNNLKCLYIVGQQCADPHMYNLSSSLGHGNVATDDFASFEMPLQHKKTLICFPDN